MPISAIDGCEESHWQEVRSILNYAIEEAGYDPNLVSSSDDIGVIQKRIIQNLYSNPIVVCDVSAKNPNVMFELGLRLAFDKPTIIVKDDRTSYSFDTSAIEHLEYPRDLRFTKIVEFREELTKRIKATVKAATTDKEYTTFLKHFGTFTVAHIDSKEVSGEELILEELRDLRTSLATQPRNRPSDIQTQSVDGSFVNQVQKAIKEKAENLGLKRRVEIREAKNAISDAIVNDVGAISYFSSRTKWNEFFDSIFSLMYG